VCGDVRRLSEFSFQNCDIRCRNYESSIPVAYRYTGVEVQSFAIKIAAPADIKDSTTGETSSILKLFSFRAPFTLQWGFYGTGGNYSFSGVFISFVFSNSLGHSNASMHPKQRSMVCIFSCGFQWFLCPAQYPQNGKARRHLLRCAPLLLSFMSCLFLARGSITIDVCFGFLCFFSRLLLHLPLSYQQFFQNRLSYGPWSCAFPR
jgi:hypothetical protein